MWSFKCLVAGWGRNAIALVALVGMDRGAETVDVSLCGWFCIWAATLQELCVVAYVAPPPLSSPVRYLRRCCRRPIPLRYAKMRCTTVSYAVGYAVMLVQYICSAVLYAPCDALASSAMLG